MYLQVFQEMTEFCDLTLKRKRKFMKLAAQRPFLELLNVAVSGSLFLKCKDILLFQF